MSLVAGFWSRPLQAPPIERFWGWGKFSPFHIAGTAKPVRDSFNRTLMSSGFVKETLIDLETLDA